MSLECACVHYNNGICKRFTDDKYTSWCNAEGLCEYIEPSNADRIRAMSDEELRDFLFNKVSDGSICSFCVPKMRTEHKCGGHCKNGILEWLKQPAEES